MSSGWAGRSSSPCRWSITRARGSPANAAPVIPPPRGRSPASGPRRGEPTRSASDRPIDSPGTSGLSRRPSTRSGRPAVRRRFRSTSARLTSSFEASPPPGRLRFCARFASASGLHGPRPFDAPESAQAVVTISRYCRVMHRPGRRLGSNVGSVNHVSGRPFGPGRTDPTPTDRTGRAPADAMAEVPHGGEGRRASAPVHRAAGGHGARLRVLGHALEPLRQVDPAPGRSLGRGVGA